MNRLWVFLGCLATLELGWLTISILKSRQANKQSDTKERTITAGNIIDYSPNTVTAIPRGQFYLACLQDGSFLALSRTCTHLGCSIPWDNGEQKFICPCHGSTFDIKGEVLTPPATRALDSYPLKIENGEIRVNIGRSEKRLDNGKPRSVKA
ncbi:ubiquinol-cytochrome c reductase iron-sulfur subunit [Desulfosediminicola flagellatus]|uniref:QcrA and Rieske domain-containing protein n=1 Tax=Desulfosediminicola flagellatus TaxID=2569541 RepID=UPI001C3D3349|nr:ubiquinol-cytochrome c reductase iron-sulfur subunit [Desulfosediminicola flagellatus]